MIVLLVILILLVVILFAINRIKTAQLKKFTTVLKFAKEEETNWEVTSDWRSKEMLELVDALNELLRTNRADKRRFQEDEQRFREIMTNLSHDIRTPLTSLTGYIQLMNTAESEDEKERYAAIVENRLTSLKELLEQIFSYTKLQNEGYAITLEPVLLNQALAEAVFSFYDEFTTRGITPQIDLPEEAIYIEGNGEALNRIVQNAVKNALVHGTGHFAVKLEKDAEGDHVNLEISNGVDNPEAIDVTQIFDRFYKADKARTGSKSTGLGLVIAKGLAEKMHGTARALVQNHTFTLAFTFPILKETL